MANKKKLIIIGIVVIVILVSAIWLVDKIMSDQKLEQRVAECSKRSPFECIEDCGNEYIYCEVDDKCKVVNKASCPVCLNIISFCTPNN